MNKYEKALEHMETCKYENRCKDCKLKLDCTFEEDHNLLQELVDKGKPMKPEIKRQACDFCGEFGFYIDCCLCPECGNDINRNEKYCPECGQKIDWSEEE